MAKWFGKKCQYLLESLLSWHTDLAKKSYTWVSCVLAQTNLIIHRIHVHVVLPFQFCSRELVIQVFETLLIYLFNQFVLFKQKKGRIIVTIYKRGEYTWGEIYWDVGPNWFRLRFILWEVTCTGVCNHVKFIQLNVEISSCTVSFFFKYMGHGGK